MLGKSNRCLMVFDPGESTGWVHFDGNTLIGGTVRMHNAYREFGRLFDYWFIDHVIYEKFMLYPGAAKALSWNTFIPCEMIGVIKYLCYLHDIEEVTEQAAAQRKFIGAEEMDRAWQRLKDVDSTKTKHTRDALMHLVYYCRLNKIPAPWQKKNA